MGTWHKRRARTAEDFMQKLSKAEAVVLPTVTLSAMLGVFTAPTSSNTSPLGAGTACAETVTCCPQEASVCVVNEELQLEDHYFLDDPDGPCPPPRN
jgi:hypothetical protein